VTWDTFRNGVRFLVKRGDLKPVWLRVLFNPEFRRAVEAALKERP